MNIGEILARWEQDNNPLFPTFSSFTRRDMIDFAEHYHNLMTKNLTDEMLVVEHLPDAAINNPDKVKYIDYNESDLRFTGWEHECIIIDRTENHYLVPENRYKELMEKKNKK